MKTLYLCEKPSQAKDIAAVLNIHTRKNGYYDNGAQVVTWCFGHLLEMANPDEYDARFKKWSFETLPIIPDTWRMNVTRSASKQFQIIKRLLGQSQHVVISTDADREGETIAREVLDLCQYQGSIERLWLSALDATSIRKALDNILADKKTRPLYYAGLGRGRADWLVGINLTRAYTLLSKQAGGDQVVSVGRVQTPTLNLMVQRDLDIESFQPVPYYDLQIDCDASGELYKARWLPVQSDDIQFDTEGRCLNAEQAQAVAHSVNQSTGHIVQFENKMTEESQPMPFDLSGLQIEASKRFSMDANAVLKAAQALYETHKATTYPRTDCHYLPLSQHQDAEQIIQALVQSDPEWASNHPVDAADISLQSRCWNDKKITAHHAIIPTSATVNIASMNDNEMKLYSLIRQRYLMQFFPKYRYQAISCTTEINGHQFISKGRVDIDQGWKILMKNRPQENQQQDDQQVLPDSLCEGLSIHVVNSQVMNKTTKPPARYTSGTLIAAMKNAGRFVQNAELRKVLKENSGIGTEATRASIIVTLQDRSYIKKSGKHLISTDFGRSLIATVPDVLKDPGTTALWEQVLDDIAQEKVSLDSFLEKQQLFLKQMIEYLQQQHIEMHYQAPQYPCPECQKPMRMVKLKKSKNKNKVFWSCTDYPDCTTTLPDQNGKPGAAQKKSTRTQLVVGQTCSICSTGNLLSKTIKSGNNAGKPFIGCSNYPKCRAFAWADPT